MNLDMMRQFIALAEEKNMHRASKKIFISQSALSQNLKKLEKELDVTLFNRENNGLSLTEYGLIFFKYSHKIIAMVEDCVSEIEEKKNGQKVIHIVTDNDYVMSFFIPHFMATHKDIKLVGKYMPPEDLPDIKNRIDSDIIISEKNYEYDNKVKSVFLTRYKLFVSVPRSNPIANRKTVCLKELEGQEFIRGNRQIKEMKRLNDYIEKNKIYLDVKCRTERSSWRIFEKRSDYLMFESSYMLMSKEAISPHRTLVEVIDKEITGYPLYITYDKSVADNESVRIFLDWIKHFLARGEPENSFLREMDIL